MPLQVDDKYLKIIESIASVAVYQVEGVASLTQQSGEAFSLGDYSKKAMRSVNAYSVNNKVIIDVSMNIYSGYVIPELACAVQQKIIDEVHKTITCDIKAVNVNIVGIIFKQ